MVGAEREWREVVRAAPRFRSGWRGLGETLIRAGRFPDPETIAEDLAGDGVIRAEGLSLKSRVAYRQSLRFRSNCPGTYLNLGCALKDSGWIEAAVGAWEQALRLAPGDPAVRQELARLGRPSPARSSPVRYLPC